jgi:hypothetical protein
MKREFMLLLFVAFCAAQGMADATIRLNNKDSQMPIFISHIGTLATTGDQIYLQILAGPIGAPLYPVTPIGGTTSIIELSEAGYFDAGVGVIPGVSGGSAVQCQLIAWQGLPGSSDPPTYESSFLRGETRWVQMSGSWDPKSGLAPSCPVLAMPSAVVVGAVPEPSTVALGILGGAALITNTLIKASRPKK